MMRDSDMHVDLDSDRTVLDQLKAEIKRIVDHREVTPGTRLPTVRQIALDLGVNANTIRRICTELSAEGYLMPKEGLGTYGVGLAEETAEQTKKVFDV